MVWFSELNIIPSYIYLFIVFSSPIGQCGQYSPPYSAFPVLSNFFVFNLDKFDFSYPPHAHETSTSSHRHSSTVAMEWREKLRDNRYFCVKTESIGVVVGCQPSADTSNWCQNTYQVWPFCTGFPDPRELTLKTHKTLKLGDWVSFKSKYGKKNLNVK